MTAVIAREAVSRLRHPAPVDQGVMLAVAVVALVANVGSVLLLRRHDEADVNVRSAFLHLAQDAVASLAVVVAALLAHTAIGRFVDPLAALLVGASVLRSACRWRGGPSGRCSRPRPTSRPPVAGARVGERFAPARLHHLHVWEIGPGSACSPRTSIWGRRWTDVASKLFGAMKVVLRGRMGREPCDARTRGDRMRERRLLGRWDVEDRACGDEHSRTDASRDAAASRKRAADPRRPRRRPSRCFDCSGCS